MCGIAGILHYSLDEAVDLAAVRAMTDAIVHRGPDADGFAHETHFALGARRLRIIDLATGDQPMTNEDGTVWAALNGEIYNYRELRVELIKRGHVFRSDCDTEVIVHQFEEDGIDCVRRFRGMFALAVWDTHHGELMIARDRFGIKPLFVAVFGGRMAFASEIKSIQTLAWPDLTWNAEGLRAFLSLGYIPSPLTAYRGVRKMAPGTVERWRLAGVGAGGLVESVTYWRPHLEPQQPVPALPEARAVATELLKESIRLHLRSDVPLGAFLSGGVDSSTVVAFMRACGVRDLKTFSIGFEDARFNELGYAQQVADHLATDHHVQIITAEDVRLLVPDLLARFDEPFADSSAIPTFLVSRLARQLVTVSLSGDGGDELFAGYTSYPALRAYRHLDRLPALLRRPVFNVAGRIVREHDRGGGFVRRATMPAEMRYFSLKYGHTPLSSLTEGSLSQKFLSFLGETDDVGWQEALVDDGSVSRAQFLDQTTYLVDDILTKVDRSSMAVSLEVRVPLLDHVFAEYVNGLPLNYKMRGRQLKLLLKQIAQPYLPAGIFARPKQGFAVPLRGWLDGPLRSLVTERLLGDETGLFDVHGVRRLLELLHDGHRDLSPRVWALLALATWADGAHADAPW